MLVHLLINRFLEYNWAGIENSSNDLHENSFNFTMKHHNFFLSIKKAVINKIVIIAFISLLTKRKIKSQFFHLPRTLFNTFHLLYQ